MHKTRVEGNFSQETNSKLTLRIDRLLKHTYLPSIYGVESVLNDFLTVQTRLPIA